jgi:monovalent cation:H+ antiporter-2, CPA2 family
VAASLKTAGLPVVVVDQQRESVERLRADGLVAVLGNATEPETLVQAHIATARLLVIATPQTLEVRRMIEVARTLNPGIEVVLRSHNAEEAALLRQEGAGTVFIGEQELARAIVSHVVDWVARVGSKG